MIIAHTLSIVKNADQILVVSDGRIAESGTHDELLTMGGKYAAMWNAEQHFLLKRGTMKLHVSGEDYFRGYNDTQKENGYGVFCGFCPTYGYKWILEFVFYRIHRKPLLEFRRFFLLDWLMVPGTEDNKLWKTGPWMKKFGTENTEIMDLLHGGGICYRTAIPTAKDYHDDCGRHGIGSGVEKKLAKNIKKWQDAGYTFTCKVFPNIGHGGLAAEHPEQFLEEAIAAHENSLEKAGHA